MNNALPKSKSVIVCKTPDEIPKVKHWAIIEKDVQVVATTNPHSLDFDTDGPSVRIDCLKYTAYMDKAEWELAVVAQTQRNHDSYPKVSFTAIEVTPAAVATSISVRLT